MKASIIRYTTLLLVLFHQTALNAQTARVSILPMSAGGLVPQQELTIVNHQAESIEAFLGITLKSHGTPLHSAPFQLQPGTNRFPIQDWIRSQNLPLLNPREQQGIEEICVEVYQTHPRERLSRNCFEWGNPIMLPPFLVYPFDQEKLQTELPLFSWIPPTPLMTGQAVNYTIKIVEMLPQHNATTAIINMPAFFTREGLTEQLLPYASSDRIFDREKTYAWQVAAYSHGQFLGRSEVWEFGFDQGPEKKEEKAGPYVELERELDSDFYPARGKVRFRFDPVYGEQKLNLQVFNEAEESIPVSRDQLIQKGDNLYVLNLPPGSGLEEGSFYYLKVTDKKGGIHQLRFQYHYPY